MERYWWRAGGGEVLVERCWWRGAGGEGLLARCCWRGAGGEVLVERNTREKLVEKLIWKRRNNDDEVLVGRR